jgi:hypothetical protein
LDVPHAFQLSIATNCIVTETAAAQGLLAIVLARRHADDSVAARKQNRPGVNRGGCSLNLITTTT